MNRSGKIGVYILLIKWMRWLLDICNAMIVMIYMIILKNTHNNTKIYFVIISVKKNVYLMSKIIKNYLVMVININMIFLIFCMKNRYNNKTDNKSNNTIIKNQIFIIIYQQCI